MSLTVAGIIAEYNPFHAGHAYHIEKTREHADGIVCVMAGAFTQRGEPAIFDKFARVRMALAGGADAVFELPTVYVVRAASDFALGGVVTLGSLGVDTLSFGCETDDLELISKIADISNDEPNDVSLDIRARLSEGKSFARARGEAISKFLGVENEFLDKPNLSLAIEYLKCIKTRFPNIKPLPVKRATDYYDMEMRAHSSAAAIRGTIYNGHTDDALRALPENVRRLAEAEVNEGVSDQKVFGDIALYVLRGMSAKDARDLPDAGEGLIDRIINLSRECADINELKKRAKCKRYTSSRVSRLIAQALLDVRLKAPAQPPYLRLLGFKESARPLIKELDRRSQGAITSDTSRIALSESFALEARATDLWGLTVNNARYRVTGRDRTEKFIIV